MGFNPNLKSGEILTNESLRRVFKCGNMGGMRKSNKTNTLVIISDHTKSLYEDKWCGEILYYTGMGKKGDQILNAFQNKTLNESNQNGVEVFLFEVFKKSEYIYRGQVKLIDSAYKEKQKDEDGIMRDVWLFPIKIIDKSNQIIAKDIIEYHYENQEKKAKRLIDFELKEKAIIFGSDETSVRIVKTKKYERNAYVTEFAKRRAGGICQLCGKNAPFQNKDGNPYLETHHIKWLSDGGSDTINNTVALCPNCHKKMHIVNNKKDVEYLIDKIKLINNIENV